MNGPLSRYILPAQVSIYLCVEGWLSNQSLLLKEA